MSDPRDTDPRHADLKRRLDPDAPSSGGSMWPWLAALVAFLVSLIDRFMEQLDQVFRLRFLHFHTRC
jgi:hypothetical protein